VRKLRKDRGAPQRNKEQQDRLFVNVPTPQETRHRAQHDSVEELFASRIEPEFDEVEREERESEEESRRRSDVW
jgi:hypothetical protein